MMFCPTESELSRLALASPFAYAIYQKNSEMAGRFLSDYTFDRGLIRQDFDELLLKFLGTADVADAMACDESHVMTALRQLRQLLMLKWIWQDALGVISLENLTMELSEFANACLDFCLAYSYDGLTARYGVPMTKVAGKVVKDEFAIIAMGKLGAVELNLSSDIDLIFVHLGDGETNTDNSDAKKSIENQKFMIHLGRSIIKLLDTVTADGFVFRVDMRLRPWGDGSLLVMNMAALAKYFDQHGRTWERFAWLKARLVNQVSVPFFETLTNTIKNFVHRYYIDYTAFSALREMKSMIINQQEQRADVDNVKLGMGGIRDIEFIVQSFALIYGGHHLLITQNPACLDSIAVLKELNFLKEDEASNLAAAYRFLRRLEHAIQARHDEQTQRLPKDSTELSAIASVMGFCESDDFLKVLNHHREQVSIPFNRMVTKRQTPKISVINEDELYAKLNAHLSKDSLALLDAFVSSKLVVNLLPEAKSRFENAYPMLLNALANYAAAHSPQADIAVPRLIELLEAICRRSIYFVMLAENPNATSELIPSLAASSWIAKELALHPILLDNFLQKRYLHLPDKSELRGILRQVLLRVERFDDENYLMSIRTFKKSQVLAVAAADILGLRHIMKVSDSLTFIAEVVLESALYRAFDELSFKHGVPKLATGERATRGQCGFAIIGYGKLGGLEMSYASDLDVVFLHNIDEKSDTDGEKPVSGMKFAMRLVQKVITYLTTQTRDGRAYELDMRLRPSGNAGVMIVSLHAFDIYQNDKAWAWEHQALVRARGIAGDGAVLDEFGQIRNSVLTKARDPQTVKESVKEMRTKMQSHLGTKGSNGMTAFHLKQDFGGLIDIEFLAQFMVLAHSHQHHNLAIWPDNVRIFEEVAKTGLWTTERCEKLTQAYLALRKKTHELALSEETAIVQESEWHELREFVQGVWQEVVG